MIWLTASYGHKQAFYVIVWDTERGHVIYLQPLDEIGGSAKDWLADAAGQLIPPRWWADAVVVMPNEVSFNYYSSHDLAPEAHIFRLFDSSQDDGDDTDAGDGSGVLGGLRRWISRTGPGPVDPARAAEAATAATTWKGQMDLAEIAAVVGQPLPVWLNETTTSENGYQTLSYDRTFITPDTVTEWPTAQQRLTCAIGTGMPGQFPAAFAALGADAADGLDKIRIVHDGLSDTGPGWYLVCRPARPAPPLDLEQFITAAQPATDPDQVRKELIELRILEGELDVEDPRGDVYAEAIRLLAWQLHKMAKAAGHKPDANGYVPVASDGLLRFSSPWQGPVIQAWTKTLTEITDHTSALRLRRVRRLVGEHPDDAVRKIYRDDQGRYILVIHVDSGLDYSAAEWPADLSATAHWTEKTIIVGDDELNATTTLLALTPTSDGRMRFGPVPMLPRMGSDTFAYGYSGGTPSGTYRALLRCALGDDTDTPWKAMFENMRGSDDAPVSRLWNTISTTKGSLRLPWPQLKLWAQEEKTHATERRPGPSPAPPAG